MSVLAHLCRSCAHPTDWHEPRNRGYTTCGCCRGGGADPDPEPTELPTMSSPGGRREPLWPPGSVRNAGTMHASTACACARCVAVAAGTTRREHTVIAGRMEGLSGR